jgi:hypothetical protein
MRRRASEACIAALPASLAKAYAGVAAPSPAVGVRATLGPRDDLSLP